MLMLYYVTLFLGVFIASDIYVWFNFVKGKAFLWNLGHWIPCILLIGVVVSSALGYFENWTFELMFFLLLCFSLPKVALTIFSLLGKGVGLAVIKAKTIGNVIGFVCAAIIFFASMYGLTLGWRGLKVNSIDISSNQIPSSFEGYKVLHISDLHVGSYGTNTAYLEKVVAKANSMNADLVCFTGDLVNSSPKELIPFINTLSALKGKDGVFSILGNHDYCTYKNYKLANQTNGNGKKLLAMEKQMGWHLLLNENKIIKHSSDSIAIVGTENDGKPPFPALADLPKAMKGLPENIYTILLSHDPSFWRKRVVAKTNIPLTLSGHTHAMQLQIGSFSPASFAFKEWGGEYKDKNQIINVSTGIGGTFLFRLGAVPQITIITLHHSR